MADVVEVCGLEFSAVVLRRIRSLGRKQDPPPGTQVLWKGIQRVDDIVETANVFTNFGADPPRPP